MLEDSIIRWAFGSVHRKDPLSSWSATLAVELILKAKLHPAGVSLKSGPPLDRGNGRTLVASLQEVYLE
jgi:hypothetical protein